MTLPDALTKSQQLMREWRGGVANFREHLRLCPPTDAIRIDVAVQCVTPHRDLPLDNEEAAITNIAPLSGHICGIQLIFFNT